MTGSMFDAQYNEQKFGVMNPDTMPAISENLATGKFGSYVPDKIR